MLACGTASFPPLLITAVVLWFAIPAIALGALTPVMFRPGHRLKSINAVAGATAALGVLNMTVLPVLPLVAVGAFEIFLSLGIVFLNRRQR
jgi:hypothetical protein